MLAFLHSSHPFTLGVHIYLFPARPRFSLLLLSVDDICWVQNKDHIAWIAAEFLPNPAGYEIIGNLLSYCWTGPEEQPTWQYNSANINNPWILGVEEYGRRR
jgi:hypothetical protein